MICTSVLIDEHNGRIYASNSNYNLFKFRQKEEVRICYMA